MHMKLLITALALVALTGCEQGGYFNQETTQMRSDKVGRVEAVGEDFRVYEFTPQTAPHMQCIFAAGDRKGGVFCFPKASASQ